MKKALFGNLAIFVGNIVSDSDHGFAFLAPAKFAFIGGLATFIIIIA